MLKIFSKSLLITAAIGVYSIGANATDLNVDAGTEELEKATEVITVAVDLPEGELLELVDHKSDLPEMPVITR